MDVVELIGRREKLFYELVVHPPNTYGNDGEMNEGNHDPGVVRDPEELY